MNLSKSLPKDIIGNFEVVFQAYDDSSINHYKHGEYLLNKSKELIFTPFGVYWVGAIRLLQEAGYNMQEAKDKSLLHLSEGLERYGNVPDLSFLESLYNSHYKTVNELEKLQIKIFGTEDHH